MARFIKKKSNLITRTVSVFCADETLGDLEVDVEKISQLEYEDLIQQGDYALCNRIVKRVGDIQDEESGEAISGQAAIDLVLDDINCISAIAGDYLEAMKTKNFRNAGSRKGR